MKKSYSNNDLTIFWEPEKCIHSGICARGLKDVFKPREKPWIQMGETSSDIIAKQIDACPSGALSYQRKA
jgi:uncharacterized Fe-S cluster protein YjdI